MHLTVCAGIIKECKERGQSEDDAIMKAHKYIKALPLRYMDQELAMKEIRAIAAKTFDTQ